VTTRRALVVYAVTLLVAGAAWEWQAPLNWDERVYYLPAIRFFAQRLPGVALNYPMPMPPLALIVQGAVYRLSGSVAWLRMLSTLAAIGAAAVFATMLGNTKRDALLLLMCGAFPMALMNAFTLKHHSIVLLCCIGALALFERRRAGAAALLLAAAALTHQIAGAAIATLFVMSMLERRFRDAAMIAASATPLVALVLFWRGVRPPMYAATFTQEPVVTGLQPAQLMVLLFMAGAWIAPAVWVRWRIAALAVPFAAIAVYATGLMRPAAVFYRLAGPVSSLVAAATGNRYLAGVIGAGALCALGAAAYAEKQTQFRIWSATYGLAMLPVPYFFESYYALFVTMAWVMLRKSIVERPIWFPVAAIAAGVGYVIAKA
jgi:hypothetical protein